MREEAGGDRGEGMRPSVGQRVESRDVERDSGLQVRGQDQGEEGSGGAHDVGSKLIVCGLLVVVVPASASGGQILPLAWPPWWI